MLFPCLLLGAVAQLGERRLCKPNVAGSIPVSSTEGKIMVINTTTGRKLYSKYLTPALLERLGQESDIAIAKELGISRERVRQWRKALGIAKAVLPRRLEWDRDAFVAAWQVSTTWAELCERLGISYATAFNRRAVLNAERSSLLPLWYNRKDAKRDQAKIRRELFVKLWNEGVPGDEIIKATGYTNTVTVGTIAALFRTRYGLNLPQRKRRGGAIDRAAFRTIWQQAKNVREVAEHFGFSNGRASATAHYERKNGVPLKYMVRRNGGNPKTRGKKVVVGAVFGQLTVIGQAPYGNNYPRWACLCECGSSVSTSGRVLRNGTLTSCERCK